MYQQASTNPGESANGTEGTSGTNGATGDQKPPDGDVVEGEFRETK
jgi:hypothetical protein